MDKKKDIKEIRLNYEFDRLGSKKLSLVYRLLFPLWVDTKDILMGQDKPMAAQASKEP